MLKMNRRKFMKTTGKIALAGATALSIEPFLSGLFRDPLKMAFASEPLGGFNVYNDINPNAKDIVAESFKDCLSKGWAPGICYKTSKSMVAVADGTVTEVAKMVDFRSRHFDLRTEKNDAEGYVVRVVHGDITSFYLHLKMPEVKFRQKVRRGEIIGYPDKRWNMPRLNFSIDSLEDPNNYGVNNSFMTYWDSATDLEIDKDEQNKRLELRQNILNTIGELVEGPEKYDLLRKKHKGKNVLFKWSRIEKFRYVEHLIQNKPETFPSLTKEQFSEMKNEFYSNQPIILTLPFKKG